MDTPPKSAEELALEKKAEEIKAQSDNLKALALAMAEKLGIKNEELAALNVGTTPKVDTTNPTPDPIIVPNTTEPAPVVVPDSTEPIPTPEDKNNDEKTLPTGTVVNFDLNSGAHTIEENNEGKVTNNDEKEIINVSSNEKLSEIEVQTLLDLREKILTRIKNRNNENKKIKKGEIPVDMSWSWHNKTEEITKETQDLTSQLNEIYNASPENKKGTKAPAPKVTLPENTLPEFEKYVQDPSVNENINKIREIKLEYKQNRDLIDNLKQNIEKLEGELKNTKWWQKKNREIKSNIKMLENPLREAYLNYKVLRENFEKAERKEFPRAYAIAEKIGNPMIKKFFMVEGLRIKKGQDRYYTAMTNINSIHQDFDPGDPEENSEFSMSAPNDTADCVRFNLYGLSIKILNIKEISQADGSYELADPRAKYAVQDNNGNTLDSNLDFNNAEHIYIEATRQYKDSIENELNNPTNINDGVKPESKDEIRTKSNEKAHEKYVSEHKIKTIEDDPLFNEILNDEEVRDGTNIDKYRVRNKYGIDYDKTDEIVNAIMEKEEAVKLEPLKELYEEIQNRSAKIDKLANSMWHSFNKGKRKKLLYENTLAKEVLAIETDRILPHVKKMIEDIKDPVAIKLFNIKRNEEGRLNFEDNVLDYFTEDEDGKFKFNNKNIKTDWCLYKKNSAEYDNTVFARESGFTMRITNKEEVRNMDFINLESSDAKYVIVDNEGNILRSDLNYENALQSLESSASYYEERCERGY